MKGGSVLIVASLVGLALAFPYKERRDAGELDGAGVTVGGSDPANNGVVEAQLVLTNSDHDRAPLKHRNTDETERRDEDRSSNNAHNGRHSESVVHSLTSHEEVRQHSEGNIASARSENNRDSENVKTERPEDEECPRGMRLDTTPGKRKSELGAPSNCVVIGQTDIPVDDANTGVTLHHNGDNVGVTTVTDNSLAEPCCGNTVEVVRGRRRRGHRRRGSRRNRNDYNTHGKLIHVEEHHRVAQYRDDRDSKSNEQNLEHASQNESPRLNYQVDANLGRDGLNPVEPVEDDIEDEEIRNTGDERPAVVGTTTTATNAVSPDVLTKDRGTQSITITLPNTDGTVLQNTAGNTVGNNMLLNNLVNSISNTVKKFQENEDARSVSQSLASMIDSTIASASQRHQNPNHITLKDVINIVEGLRGGNTPPCCTETEKVLPNTAITTGTVGTAPVTTATVQDGRNNEFLMTRLRNSFSSLLDELLNSKGNAITRLQNYNPNQIFTTTTGRNVNGLTNGVLQNNVLTTTNRVTGTLNGNDADVVSNDRNVRINLNDGLGTNRLTSLPATGLNTLPSTGNQVVDTTTTLNGNVLTNGAVTNGDVVTTGVTNGLTPNCLTPTGLNTLRANDCVNTETPRMTQLMQMANLLKDALLRIPAQAIRKGTVQKKPNGKKGSKKSSKRSHSKKKSSIKKKSN